MSVEITQYINSQSLGNVIARTGFDSLFDFHDIEVEDDPDILEDPIYSMDIQVSAFT